MVSPPASAPGIPARASVIYTGWLFAHGQVVGTSHLPERGRVMGEAPYPVGFTPTGPTGKGGGRRPGYALTEREVLLRLYAATGGAEGCWRGVTHWGSERPLAEWYGVFVDGTGQVESLLLAGNGLQGALPEELKALPGLTSLDLTGNRLTGTIPGTLGDLAALTFLDLSHNRLTGTIPGTLGALSQLRILRLGHNQLTGIVPRALGALPRLEMLQLAENRLENLRRGEWSHIPQLDLEPQRRPPDP